MASLDDEMRALGMGKGRGMSALDKEMSVLGIAPRQPEPEPDEGILSNIWKGSKAGVAGSIGGLAGWFGGKNAVTDYTDEVLQENQRSREHDGYDADYFLNGSGFAYDVGNLLGSFASMAPAALLVPGGAPATIASAGARLLGGLGARELARRAAVQAAQKGGGALGNYIRYGLGAGTAESLVEGGSGVSRAVQEGQEGLSPYLTGAEIAAKNWPLLVGSQALEGGILHKGFSRLGGKAGESLGTRAWKAPFRTAPYMAGEGLTESAQEVMQERAQEEAFNEPTGGFLPSDMTENERKALYATFAPAALLGGIGGVRGSMRAKGNEPEGNAPAPYVANWDNGMNGLDTDLFDKWESAPGMTDLTGVRRDVVAALNGLANEYGGKITITGAAEKGVHAEGADGHEGGWKVDIDKNLADPEKFLELAAKYGFAVGDEGDHYDLSANRKGGVGGKQVATPDAFVSDGQQPSGQREGHENAWAIYDVFKQAGYNDNAIAGILGRVQQEHNFDTSDVPEHEEEGMHLGGYGMFQWNGGRTTAFLNWAQENGLDPQDATTQARYALLEAQQRGLTPEKMNQLSHEEAADLWTSDWEVGKPGDERKYAGEWLTRLQNGGGVAGGTTPSTRAPQAQQEPQIDTYDDVYEQFAKEQMETSTDAEEVDYFSGFFNSKGKFKDTPENRQKLEQDYGEELKQFAEAKAAQAPTPKAQPQETQIETQTENLDKLKAKLGKFKGRAIKRKDFNTATQINKAVQTNDVPAMQNLVNQLEGTQQASSQNVPQAQPAFPIVQTPSQNAPQPAQQTEQAQPIQVPTQANEAPQTGTQQTQEELLKRLQELNQQNDNTQNVINEFDDMQRQLEERAGVQTGGNINGNTQSTQSTQTQPTQSINTTNQNQNAELGQAEAEEVNQPVQQETPQPTSKSDNFFPYDMTYRNGKKFPVLSYHGKPTEEVNSLAQKYHGIVSPANDRYDGHISFRNGDGRTAEENRAAFLAEINGQKVNAPNEESSSTTSTPVQVAPKKKSKALSQFKKNVAKVVDKYRNDETTYEKAFQKIADMQVAAEHVAPDEATVQEIRQVAEDGINQLNAIFAEKQGTPSQTAQEGAGGQETTAQVEEPTQGEKPAQNATVEENSTVANEEKLKKDYSSMSLDELKAERQKWIDEEVARWKKNPGGKGSNNGLIYSEYDPVTGKPTGEVTGRTSESLNPDWYQWAYKRNGGKAPAKRDYPMFADEYLRNTQEYDELVNEIERREAEPKQEKPTKKQEAAEGKTPAQESIFGDEAENEKDLLEALGITEDETEEVSFGNEFGDTTDEEIEALKKELQKELSKLSANPVFNPRIYTLGLQLGGKYIQKGYRTFKKWLEKMTSDLGENIEPWAPAIWETLKTYPKGQKFDPKQIMAFSKLIGSKFERGVTSLEDVNADMKKLLKGRYKEFAPMIEASYNGIEKYFSTIKEGENNVNDSTRGLASRTGEGVNKDSVGRDDESGRPGRGSKREGGQEAEHDVQQQDSAGIYDSSPSRSGKTGNSGVQAEESADRSGGTRDTELSGSVRDSYEGSVALDDGRKAEDINPAEERPVNAAAEKVSKEKANTPYKAGDLDSIKADLPMLRPEQQEDVQRIEKRLLVDKGQGFLCTNGTGTGKTYSGLGVIKRAYEQGKKNILVVAPKAEIIKQWIEAAKTDFSLDIKQLSDTKDNGGKGICITTYANFQANRELAARDWDMIVADESHTLLENKDASETSALKMLRSLTEHPRQLYNRWKLKNRTKKIRALENKLDEYESKLAKLVADHNKHKVSDSVYGERSVSLKNSIKQTENAIAEEYRSMNDQWKEVEKQWKAIPSEDKPKVLFMSATPFAYDKSIDYVEGYLFNYNEDTNPGSYHNQSGFEQFMIQKFGYRFRYGKLAKPEAQVDNRVMEIQFHDDLVDAGVMYGRQIDLPVDYDRGFLLVDGGIGNKIDEGFKFLWDNNKKYGKLAEALRKQFDTRAKRYLIESIKAKAVVPIVQEYIKSGKKVVLFHQSMQEKLNVHPFQLKNFSDRQVTEQWELFKKERPDLVAMRFDDIPAPMTTLKSAFKDALYLDGSQEHKKSRNNAVKLFQDDDSGKNLIICQQDAANAGVSLHDTTGKHQRVLINIATPERPIYAMQIEGRIYRVGSVTNAIFRYLSTGTELEKSIFANTIGSRAETAENLALGVDARGLRDSFTNLFMETLDDSWERRKPGHPEEGTGGKEMDFSGKSDVTLWERAKSFYYGQQKKTGSTKAREGKDYFATPEPIGLKMVEWLGLKDGDSALEPSAGHGAISRWFSPNTNNTIVEPSGKLAPLAQMVTPNAKVVQDNFENFNVVNKFDGIAMNPPFGAGGKTAVDHIAKAFRHLKDGGRLIAILPQGPSADAHFDKWFYGLNKKGEQVEDGVKNGVLTADISLPGVTFNRAGTGVATRIVVIDKHNNEAKQQKAWEKGGQQVDLSNIKDINELFDRMENMTVPERVKGLTAQDKAKSTNGKKYVLPAEGVKGNKTSYMAVVNDAEDVTSDDVKELAKTYRGKYIPETDSFVFDFKEERDDFIRAANDLLAKSKNPPELRDSYPAEIDGTPITIHSDGRITGKTYDIKDTIKENGGKWDRDTRVWRINDPAKLTKFINKYNTEGVQVDEQEEDTSTAFNVKESDGQYIANVKDKLEYDTYKDVLELAKKHGGDYKKGKGFVFDNEADLNEFVEVADALLGMGDAKYSITAWHGSPHDFETFSLGHIGSGEGAQVHGWGLYFAGNRNVSEHYRDELSYHNGKVLVVDGVERDWNYSDTVEDKTLKRLIQTVRNIGDVEKTRERLAKVNQTDMVKQAIQYIDEGRVKVEDKKGSLFQVEIPDESEMLDEQRPVDSQPARYALHDILESALEDNQLRNWAKNELPDSYKPDMSREQVVNLLWDSMKVKNGGRDFYQGLARWAMETEGKANPKAASELLNTYGIPGIVYEGGQDGRCYVVFDDEAIEIIGRFSKGKEKLRNLLRSMTFPKDSELTSQEQEIVNFGKQLGVKVVWFDGNPNLHGFHQNNITFLNRRSVKDVQATFYHETFHWLKNNNPAFYQELLASIEKAGVFTQEQLDAYREKTGRYDLSNSDAIEEMLADEFIKPASRHEVLGKLARQNKSIVENLIAWMKQMVDRIASVFHNPQGKLTTAQRDAFVKSFNKMAASLRDQNGRAIFKTFNDGKEIMLANGVDLNTVALSKGKAVMATDKQYMNAVNKYQNATSETERNKAFRELQDMVEDAAELAGFENAIPEQTVAYKTRTKAAPKKSIKVYKVFTVADDGSPTALFIGGTEKLPQGVWLDAQAAYHFKAANGKYYVPSTQNPYTKGGKTGAQVEIPSEEVRQELVKRGFIKAGSTASKITALAYRPGWHAGTLPFFPQGGMKPPKGMKSGYPNIHRYNQVVFECELSADKDYTQEAENQPKARKKDGTLNTRDADLQYMPEDGYYYYATNPMTHGHPELGMWAISGSLKINRALTQEECDRILAEHNMPAQEWEQGKMNLEDLGYTGPQHDAARKTLAPITYDDNGEVIPLSERFNPNIDDIRFSADIGDSEKSFLDKLAGKFGRKVDSRIQTAQTEAPKGIGLFSYYLGSPSRIAEKVKSFKPFYTMADKAMNLITKNRTDFMRKYEKAWGLCKKQEEKDKLSEILLLGDSEEKEFTREEILAEGGSENVAKAYETLRRLTRKAYNLVNEARKKPKPHSRRLTDDEIAKLKENKFIQIQKITPTEDGRKLVTYKEFANWQKEYDVTPEELARFQADDAIQILESHENEDGTTHVKVREGIGDLTNRKGYIPHIFHEYMVRVKDKDGNVVEDYGYGGVLTSGRNEKEAVAKAEEWLKNNKLKDGETIYVAPKVFDFNTLGMSEKDYGVIMGDKDYDTMMESIADNNEMTLKEVKDMLGGSVRKKNRHRFFGHVLKRQGAKGYEENMQWALRHYFNSAIRYHAMETEFKPQAISLFERLFGDFDKKHTGIAAYTQDFINDINGNPTQLELWINDTLNRIPAWRKFVVASYGDRAALKAANSVTNLMSHLCLGYLNVSSALLNFSQAINAAAYLGHAKYAPMVIARGSRKFSPKDLKVLIETNVGNDIGLDSGSGYDKARSVGGVLSTIGNKGMILFKKSEQTMRFGTTLVAYDKAIAEGKTHDEAIKYAREINRKSNFDYSVADAPNIFRRGSIISQICLQFKKYGFKEAEVVGDMLPGNTKTSKAQKAIFWAMYLLTAGLLQVPLLDWWDKLIGESLYGGKESVQKAIMEAAGDSPLGQVLAKTAMYGIVSNIGIDMSKRTGLADVVPTKWSDLAGPAPSKIFSFINDVAAGNKANAIRDVSPGIYNQYAAWIAGHSEGGRNRTTATYDDTYSKILRSMGFSSTDERMASDIQQIMYKEREKLKAQKQKAIDAFIADPSNENAKKLKELGVKPSTVKKERERKKRDKLDRIKVDMSKEEMKRNKDLFRFAE